MAVLAISKIFELIILLRVVKLLTLMYEVRVLRLILETLKNLASPMKNLLVVFISIFYGFTALGSFFFGGKITVNSPEILSDLSIPQFYYLVNFNDFISSCVTLFILLVVNNWNVAV